MATPTRAARQPSVKDVAAAAGVSLGTVSNVLNRPQRVSTNTRERVVKAMKDLGFVRNESARQLRAGSSRSIAYLMLDVTNPFFTDVAQGIEESARAAGLALFMCGSAGDPDQERAYLEHLTQQRVQGILITPIDPDSETLRGIAQRGTSIVLVDRAGNSRDYCSVSVDDHRGGYLAAEHLVDRGHSSLAFVGGPLSLGQVSERLAGAKDAWRDSGLPDGHFTVLATADMSVAAGRRIGERLAGLPKHRRPTAAFCANDLLALGLLQHAMASGARVPEDLAIVGYDDIYFAAAAAVPLTSVSQPRHELGRAASALLMDESTNQSHAHEQVVFTPELVARRST